MRYSVAARRSWLVVFGTVYERMPSPLPPPAAARANPATNGRTNRFRRGGWSIGMDLGRRPARAGGAGWSERRRLLGIVQRLARRVKAGARVRANRERERAG